MADLAAALRAAVPGLTVLDDADVMDSYRRDQAPGLPAGLPAAVAMPEDTAQVAAAVATAAEYGAPIVVRGAGSGLAGAANAVDGCLVLSTQRMNRILSVDPAERLATVQPGVINADLRRAVAEKGLFYPPDPGSYEMCTVGGNAATNAGGMCCVKYGVTGDYVRGLEAVLADGSVLRTGGRTVKGVAGYDLTSLLVGSEGTLAVITELSLALRPAPAPPRTIVAQFGSAAAAGAAVTAVLASGAEPSILEIIDATTLRAIEEWQPLGVEAGTAAMVIAQSDSSHEEDLRLIEAACAGASEVIVADDAAESEMLMQARRLAYPALERLGATLLDDVAVPLPKLVELIEGVEAIAKDRDMTVGLFGHAGDGNMHPTVVYPHGDADAERRAFQVFDEIVALALRLGGTVTGEHGVGLLKRSWLERELGEPARRTQRAIKAALDPHDLLNPGKAIA
ncbi:FAD-binding oxidoreductase [Nonomuraea endophytica]|uniref:Glycolate oxidase n=1 Tax=Nonomuraea endophytica TaxID=714136 RepID=A0A7W8A4U8_9ACTN|nr:FAD-linked oxidase C-terminal domain-containing protein [Nonomuraea endophytica]MBB5079558.1 glycolate oxidase [Nonomuraea endophytica]